MMNLLRALLLGLLVGHPVTAGAGSLTLLGVGKPGAAAAPYAGPVDINGAAYVWWGLRGISAAYSTGSNPAIDIVDQAGAHTLTVNILSNGNLDIASINTWVTTFTVTTIKVTKLYDQSGSGIHVTQGTLANMPTLVLSGVPGLGASKPAILFASASTQIFTGTSTTVVNGPFTVTGVAQATSNTEMYYIGSNSSVGNGFDISAVTNVAGIYNGTVLTQAAAINNFYALQGLHNSSSNTSASYVNGNSATAVLSSANPMFNAASTVYVGRDSFGRPMNGYLTETGVWASDKSANFSAINSQQRAYWGF